MVWLCGCRGRAQAGDHLRTARVEGCGEAFVKSIGGKMTQSRKIPVDERIVKETDPDSSDVESATTAGRLLRERILSDPKGKAAYDRAWAEIDRHQANLAQVRKARSLAQATVAEAMAMDQSEVSRLEHRSDVMLSTLRRFIEATGGGNSIWLQPSLRATSNFSWETGRC